MEEKVYSWSSPCWQESATGKDYPTLCNKKKKKEVTFIYYLLIFKLENVREKGEKVCSAIIQCC